MEQFVKFQVGDVIIGRRFPILGRSIILDIKSLTSEYQIRNSLGAAIWMSKDWTEKFFRKPTKLEKVLK